MTTRTIELTIDLDDAREEAVRIVDCWSRDFHYGAELLTRDYVTSFGGRIGVFDHVETVLKEGSDTIETRATYMLEG